LLARVGSWLESEGYPLEFATAAEFRRVGLDVRQAEYTKQSGDRPRREVDVVAHLTRRGVSNLRIEFVVECKWSAEKPWVLFASPDGMTPAACVTQSFGSQLAELLAWKEAGCSDLAKMSLFRQLGRTSFGGRQAFSKSADVVFDALRAVTGNAYALAREYDGTAVRPQRNGLPEWGTMTVPVIVVEGRLFEAFDSGGTMGLEEVDASRVHFRGAEGRGHGIATVHIVRANALRGFVDRWATEADLLLQRLAKGLSELESAVASRTLERLPITRGARGMIGVPPLLIDLVDRQQDGVAAEKERQLRSSNDDEGENSVTGADPSNLD
jgi:hypothetical protein